MVFYSKCESDTIEFAKTVANVCKGGEVILLNGDLGAGKTTFTKGFAKALGIHKTVKSPTFTLMKTYTDGRLPLYHFDLYRIGGEEELEELGFSEYLNGDGICVIEWNKFTKLYGKVIDIHFEYLSDNERRITVSGL